MFLHFMGVGMQGVVDFHGPLARGPEGRGGGWGWGWGVGWGGGGVGGGGGGGGWGVAQDSPRWGLKNGGGNSHWSRDPIMQWRTRQSQFIF